MTPSPAPVRTGPVPFDVVATVRVSNATAWRPGRPDEKAADIQAELVGRGLLIAGETCAVTAAVYPLDRELIRAGHGTREAIEKQRQVDELAELQGHLRREHWVCIVTLRLTLFSGAKDDAETLARSLVGRMSARHLVPERVEEPRPGGPALERPAFDLLGGTRADVDVRRPKRGAAATASVRSARFDVRGVELPDTAPYYREDPGVVVAARLRGLLAAQNVLDATVIDESDHLDGQYRVSAVFPDPRQARGIFLTVQAAMREAFPGATVDVPVLPKVPGAHPAVAGLPPLPARPRSAVDAQSPVSADPR